MKHGRSYSKKILMILFWASACSSLAGCEKQVEEWVGASLRPPELTPPISFKAVAASEFVSGSRPYSQTIQRGYFSSVSAGGLSSEVVQTSTTRGYKVYSSVQGVLLSESIQH